MTVVCVFFRGPVNEDVFAAPAFHGGKIVDSDIQEISEQIHRLLLQVWAHTLDSGIKYTFSYQHLSVSVTNLFCLQPIHNMGSSGYGSHGSNGSHEQLVSISSSSESNGNAGKTTEETGKAKPPRTFQEICKGVHMLKNHDSQVCLRSPSLSPSPSPSKPEHKKTTDSEFSLISPTHSAVALTHCSLQGACLL